MDVLGVLDPVSGTARALSPTSCPIHAMVAPSISIAVASRATGV
jgi:hypothetical protein